MKRLLLTVFLIGILAGLALRFDPLGWRPYRSESLAGVKLLLKAYERRLDVTEREHERLSVAPIDTRVIGAEGRRAQDLLSLSDMAQALRYHVDALKKEIALRGTLEDYHLGFLAPHYLPLVLSALSLVLFLLLALRERLISPIPVFASVKELESPPGEEYITEGELPRKIETGFASKKEALQWLKEDPGCVCEYCGSRMKAQSTGTIRQMTFYKKVPAGVKDQRVNFGT